MNLESTIESTAEVHNAGGMYYLAFSYMSTVGKTTEPLSVQVPIKSDQPTTKDKSALLEAVTMQGAIGEWIQKTDGSTWLVPKK